MIVGNAPFSNMTHSFGFFAELGKRWGTNFIPMSAGVNWIQASAAIQALLRVELDSASTYRNYGRALGLRPVTDLLAAVEANISGNPRAELAVTMTNGTTEGACLIQEALLSDGKLRPGDPAFIIGHAYALYELQAKQLGLKVHQVLGDDQCRESFLPSIDRVEEGLNTARPRIVFLVVPNNPLGEVYSFRHTVGSFSGALTMTPIFWWTPGANDDGESHWPSLDRHGTAGSGIEIVICTSHIQSRLNAVRELGYTCSALRFPRWGSIEFLFRLPEGYLIRVKQPPGLTPAEEHE